MTGSPSSFVTLTYDDENYGPSLEYGHFQEFMRAVRYRFGPTRFFCAAEYGGESGRPHFHAILFGVHFSDGVPVGKDIFSSKILSEMWGRGFSSFGQVTYQSAAYVAGYCLKKIASKKEPRTAVDMRTGEMVEIEPERARMSLKPGIGASWFQKYWKEVYLARDGCVLKGGQRVPAPKYYDKLLEELDGDLKESKDYERFLTSKIFSSENSEDRLKVKETVVLSKLAQRKRRL